MIGKMKESLEFKKELSPKMLDIISIDGRWAQVAGILDDGELAIRWLDDKSGEHIDLKKYKLNSTTLFTVVADIKERFQEREINNIHWGTEQEQDPTLKLKVTVFGEYVELS